MRSARTVARSGLLFKAAGAGCQEFDDFFEGGEWTAYYLVKSGKVYGFSSSRILIPKVVHNVFHTLCGNKTAVVLALRVIISNSREFIHFLRVKEKRHIVDDKDGDNR